MSDEPLCYQPTRKISKPCPLCRDPIEVWEQPGLQHVVCSSCGLHSTIDASPPPPPVVLASPATEHEDSTAAVIHWLEREPGPLLPNPDFLLEARKKRQRRMAISAAAVLIAVGLAGLAAHFGYAAARNQFALHRTAEHARAQQKEARLLAAKKRVERQRQEAERKRTLAEREMRLVTAKYLASQVQIAAGDNSWRGLAIATQAVNATLAPDGFIAPEAHQSLRDALARCADAHHLDGIALEGHDGPVTALAASPDGRWLASGSLDHTVRLWDLRARQPQRSAVVLDKHTARVSHVLFSADSRWLVTGSYDSAVCVWDLARRSPESSPIVLPGQQRPINRMALSPDGRWLATICASSRDDLGSVRLWDLGAGAAGATSLDLKNQGGRIQTVAISPDSRWLAIGVDETIRLWDLNSRVPAVASLDRRCHHGCVSGALFTNDGRWLVTCGGDPGASGLKGTAQLWNLTAADPSTSIVLRGHAGSIGAMAASSDGRWLVTAGMDRSVRVWNLQAADPGADAFVLSAGQGALTAAAISGDGRWLAVSADDGSVYLWSFSAAGPVGMSVMLRSGDGKLFALTFTPDNRWLAAAGADWTVRLWNLDIEELVKQATSIVSARDEPLLKQISKFLAGQALLSENLPSLIGPSKYAVWKTIKPHAENLQQRGKGILGMAMNHWSKAVSERPPMRRQSRTASSGNNTLRGDKR